VFEVNVFGTVRITQAVIPAMKAKGAGRIITVSSIAGLFSGPLSAPYAMTSMRWRPSQNLCEPRWSPTASRCAN
jgi:NADP-dependent 3-hydroxy acid dehydrogenase YdfG